MSSGIVAIMLATSILIGLVGLIGFLWGLKSGQFDDANKMTQGILFDSPKDLQEAIKTETNNKNQKESKIKDTDVKKDI